MTSARRRTASRLLLVLAAYATWVALAALLAGAVFLCLALLPGPWGVVAALALVFVFGPPLLQQLLDMDRTVAALLRRRADG